MNDSIQDAAHDSQERQLLTSTLARAEEINSQVNRDFIPEGFEIDESGIWYLQEKKDGFIAREWICSPLWVTGYTRDHQNNNHGRILEFQDVDGHKHLWTMPMELLAGETAKILGALYNMGLKISPKRYAKDKLLEYITQCNPARKVRCILQCGWFKMAFVLPSETIGCIQSERIIYQNPSVLELKGGVSGELSQWKDAISKKACGNSRLQLVISASFAGPLLHLLNHENIGIHLRGGSSLGKSTAVHVANSVWDSPASIHTYRATANGLEGIAFHHNDQLLCLDELSQASSHEAGHVIYMLGNGIGKGRASQSGHAKKQTSWRLVFLSTGEISLEQLMNEGGKKIKAGQEVRFIDIPADTEVHGLFEVLHGCEGGAELSTNLKDSCVDFYGVASRAFLKRLVEDVEGAIDKVQTIMNGLRQRYLPKNSSSQVTRVFNHLALIGAAGELASQFGVTGWKIEEAISGVMKCFQDWLRMRGDLGVFEEAEALSQVRSFFELHGESRFTPWDRSEDDKTRTVNRMGFRRETETGTEFYVYKDAFRKEICKGLDFHYVEKVCVKMKLLLPSENGSPTRSERLPGSLKTQRCYRVTLDVSIDENG